MNNQPRGVPFRIRRGVAGSQFVYKVIDDTGALDPFYVWREGDSLWAANEPLATIQLRRLIDPAEWNREYGGLIDYAELLRGAGAASIERIAELD